MLAILIGSCGLTPPEPPNIPEDKPPYQDTMPQHFADDQADTRQIIDQTNGQHQLTGPENRQIPPTPQGDNTSNARELQNGSLVSSPPFDETTQPPQGGTRVALDGNSPSACQDRRNENISIQGQEFTLAGWSDVAWAITKDRRYQQFVTKIGDYFVFLQNNLTHPVLIAGTMYTPTKKKFNGALMSLTFAGIYDNTYDHPVARVATRPDGYTLKYIWNNQQNTRTYDAEFQFGHEGACLARFYTEQQTPFSGGEPVLVLKSIPNISYYKTPGS